IRPALMSDSKKRWSHFSSYGIERIEMIG
ncbi:MAG: hypothetical protein JWN44_7229, partial [Myxococcales bacterium]|nr:hypothetical protein [Myxococcales bacterium]